MNSRGSTLAVRRRYSRAFLCRAFPVPLHLCTACCLVPPARTNGAKYLRRLEPQACCARPSAGPHCGPTEIDLWCYASIIHASDMDQPSAGNALLYANRQRFVMLIGSNLVGCSTGKSAASLREDIELAANSQRASERLYKPVSRGRERLMPESGRSDTFSTASGRLGRA